MIKVFYKLLRDAYVTVKLQLNESKSYRKSSIKYIYQLFIIRFIFGHPKFRNLIKAKKINSDIMSKDFLLNIKAQDVVNKLDIDGCTNTFTLKKNILQNIKDEALQNLNSPKAFSFDGKLNLPIEQKFINLEELQNFLIQENMYVLKNDMSFRDNSKIKEIFTDKFFIDIAENYLGSKKMTFSGTFFATNNISNNLNYNDKKSLKSKTAQLYHCDVNFKKFFKIIIYLSDVKSEMDGAHVYIPGSHSQKHTRHIVTDRFSDEDVEKSYKRKNVYIGDAGTLFFVDNFGIHKGSTVENNFRTAILLEYGRGHFQNSKNAIFI
ncbi:hypothetical protein N8Y94_02590 [Candidatus Pelagibacter ubique]|mgnify:CR=1 FL=1|jgi:hypothetical protein|nr:hypothetical protein [Candidatus Pelagibacter ubique]